MLLWEILVLTSYCTRMAETGFCGQTLDGKHLSPEPKDYWASLLCHMSLRRHHHW
uniref:Uncharacterized protein n=1 Tax=Anguilla anguilla TaxID=7936 RepID=A0A0E9XW16_ANGAN